MSSTSSIESSGSGPAGGGGCRTSSAAFFHSCGVTTTGLTYCWGRNTFGQLGNGSLTSSPVPVLVADP